MRRKPTIEPKRETDMKHVVPAVLLSLAFVFFAGWASAAPGTGSGLAGELPGVLPVGPADDHGIGEAEVDADSPGGAREVLGDDEDEEESPGEAPEEAPGEVPDGPEEDLPEGPEDLPAAPANDDDEDKKVYVYTISLIRIKAYVEGVGEKKDKTYVDPALKDIGKLLVESFKFKQFHSIDKVRIEREGIEAKASYRFDPLIKNYYIVISPVSGVDKISASCKIFRHKDEKKKEKVDVEVYSRNFSIKSGKGAYISVFPQGDNPDEGSHFIFGIKIKSVEVQLPK